MAPSRSGWIACDISNRSAMVGNTILVGVILDAVAKHCGASFDPCHDERQPRAPRRAMEQKNQRSGTEDDAPKGFIFGHTRRVTPWLPMPWYSACDGPDGSSAVWSPDQRCCSLPPMQMPPPRHRTGDRYRSPTVLARTNSAGPGHFQEPSLSEFGRRAQAGWARASMPLGRAAGVTWNAACPRASIPTGPLHFHPPDSAIHRTTGEKPQRTDGPKPGVPRVGPRSAWASAPAEQRRRQRFIAMSPLQFDEGGRTGQLRLTGAV